MSGLVASRRLDSWWQRLAQVTCLLVGGQLAASAVEITTFNSTNVNLSIPRPAAGNAANRVTESVMQVSGIQTGITQVTVSIFINHRWPADLRITLIPPGGGAGVRLLQTGDVFSTQVASFNPNPGITPFSNRNSFNTGIGISNLPAGRVVFSDNGVAIDPDDTEHVNNLEHQVHLLPGTYLPDQALTGFNDLQPAQSNGTWRLRIEDVFLEADDGTLVGWSMTITEPGPHIWTGGGADDNWNTDANWQDNNKPTTAEGSSLLIFPLAAAGPSVNNIGEIRTVTMTVAGGYDFSATGPGSLTLIANSTLSVNSTVNVNLNMPIALVGQPTITVAGTGGLDLLGIISNDGAAAGLILNAGTTSPVVISGANTYTGVTAINSGVIDITNNAALGGVGGGGTTIASGASLRVAAGLNLANETVSVQGIGVGGIGSLVFTNGGTLNGLTLVSGVPGTISILGGAVNVTNVTAAAPTAVHTLSITNAGTTLNMNGALPTRTALNLIGGATTFGVAQPNITALSLSNGADLNVGPSATISGNISVGASATNSEISGTTLSLGGGTRSLSVADGTAAPDLTITVPFTTGSLDKRDAGTVLWNGSPSTANLVVSAGEVTGSGSVGNLSVGGAKFSPTGVFAVANLTLGAESWLAFNNSPINATGTVTLQGGILQPLSNGTVIGVSTGNATGTFAHYPGAPVNYTTGGDGNDVSFTASGGASASFTAPLTFNGAEGGGPVQLAVTSTGAMTIAIVSAGGGLTPGGDFTLINNFAINGATNINLAIFDDFVDEGTETGQLIIIPLTGGVAGNPNGSVTLTITDNDESDKKSCGFGTGFTVFLLLGFALFFHLRLRRP